LGDKSLVVFILRRDKFGDEIFTVSLGNGFRLGVKNICEVIVIFLLGSSDLDVGNDVDTRREVDL